MTERELFEAWAESQKIELHKVTPCDGSSPYYGVGNGEWAAWQAGRAPLLARIAELEAALAKALDALAPIAEAERAGIYVNEEDYAPALAAYDELKAALSAQPTDAPQPAQEQVKPEDDAFMLRACANRFYNATIADPDVIIRAPTAEKRDAISLAAKVLAHALTQSPEYVANLATPQATAPSAEPVARLWQHDETARTKITMWDENFYGPDNHRWNYVGELYLHPPSISAELAAMTAERDKLKGDVMRLVAQRNEFDEVAHVRLENLKNMTAYRDKWQTAYNDALAEVRKLGEELGALKGERAEMEKDAARYRYIRKLSAYEFTELWKKHIHSTSNFDDLVDAYIAEQSAEEGKS